MTMRTKLLLLLAGSATFFLASCNTISGLGQDIQRTGQGVENLSQGRHW